MPWAMGGKKKRITVLWDSHPKNSPMTTETVGESVGSIVNFSDCLCCIEKHVKLQNMHTCEHCSGTSSPTGVFCWLFFLS